jgi:hypothetical protein
MTVVTKRMLSIGRRGTGTIFDKPRGLPFATCDLPDSVLHGCARLCNLIRVAHDRAPHQTLPLLIHIFNNPTPNIPSIRQLRITDTVHRIIRNLFSHPQIRIQLIQISDGLTSCIQLIPSIGNQHCHPDKWNWFSRDSSNTFSSYSLGSGGEALAGNLRGVDYLRISNQPIPVYEISHIHRNSRTL